MGPTEAPATEIEGTVTIQGDHCRMVLAGRAGKLDCVLPSIRDLVVVLFRHRRALGTLLPVIPRVLPPIRLRVRDWWFGTVRQDKLGAWRVMPRIPRRLKRSDS